MKRKKWLVFWLLMFPSVFILAVLENINKEFMMGLYRAYTNTTILFILSDWIIRKERKKK